MGSDQWREPRQLRATSAMPRMHWVRSQWIPFPTGHVCKLVAHHPLPDSTVRVKCVDPTNNVPGIGPAHQKRFTSIRFLLPSVWERVNKERRGKRGWVSGVWLRGGRNTVVEFMNASRQDMLSEKGSAERASGGPRRWRCLWGDGAVLLLHWGRGSRTLHLCRSVMVRISPPCRRNSWDRMRPGACLTLLSQRPGLDNTHRECTLLSAFATARESYMVST